MEIKAFPADEKLIELAVQKCKEVNPDINIFKGRISTMDKFVAGKEIKKEIKKKMAGVERANIAVRNFPMTAQELRKRLKWKEGGHFVFGTTLVSGTRILILGEKLQ